MLYLGCFFLWGNICPYVESYFFIKDPNISFSFTFLVDSVLVLFNWIGYNIGTYLLMTRNWSPKLVVSIGCFIALTGVYASSFAETIAAYLALYAGMNGIGCGMCYLIPLVCCWEYFPERKGLVTGITISAYGFGSFFFGIIAIDLVNPDHESPTIPAPTGNQKFFDADIANRVPHMIQTLVYIWAFLVVIAVCLVSRKPKDELSTVEDEEEENDNQRL